MTRTANWLYGWLLLLARGGAARAVHALPGGRDAVAQLRIDAEGRAPGRRLSGVDNYRQLIDDPIFWKALTNNLWYAAGNDSAVDRARAR